MKRIISVLLTFTLLFAISFTTAMAKHDDKNDNNGNKSSASVQTEDDDTEDSDTEDGDDSEENQGKGNNKKAFKAELNEQKKELQSQKEELSQQLDALEAEYEELIASGDTEAADALLEEINSLKDEIDGVKSQIKQTINERYMVVKTMYSDEELAQFESASDLIEQMYEDAYALEAGCVTVNNNLIKFEAPPYIKGGVTMVPVRAITAQLGAEVSWDSDTQTVSVVKDDVTIELTIDSYTVYVNGEAVDLDLSAEISCSRTYVPLRFIAETFGLAVSWDDENEIIDLDGSADDGSADDGSADDGSADDGSADDGSADDGSADDGSADDGSADDGSADDGSADDGSVDDGTSGEAA